MRARLWLLAAIGFLSLGMAFLAAGRLARAEPTFNGTAYPGSPPAPDFTLTDHTGATTSLASQRGRPVLLFFGFTRCPDVCPLTLRKLRNVLDDTNLGDDDVSVLFVSVDPEHDTPERLAAYVEGVGPNIIGLTGDQAAITKVLDDYDAYAAPAIGHDGHPTLAHSTIVFGIDRDGLLRVLIHAEEPAEIVEEDVRALVGIG
jgi:protein SCO1